MCGLISVMSKDTMNRFEKKMLKELFVLTTLRGVDSTGLVYADRIDENCYRQMKSEGNFFDLVGNYPDSLMTIKADFVMGHCRWSTVGESTKDNAHPYVFKNLIGMHNGTLEDDEFTPSKFLSGKESWKADKTDSWLFFNKLSKSLKEGKSYDDVVKDLSWRSAYAMVVWDLKHTVSVFRNSDRPLYMGVSKKNGTIVLASEHRYLEFVDNKEIDLDIQKIEVSTLYQFNLDEIGHEDKPWAEIELSKKDISWGSYEKWWRNSYEYDDWHFDPKLGCYVEGSKGDPRTRLLD